MQREISPGRSPAAKFWRMAAATRGRRLRGADGGLSLCPNPSYLDSQSEVGGSLNLELEAP